MQPNCLGGKWSMILANTSTHDCQSEKYTQMRRLKTLTQAAFPFPCIVVQLSSSYTACLGSAAASISSVSSLTLRSLLSFVWHPCQTSKGVSQCLLGSQLQSAPAADQSATVRTDLSSLFTSVGFKGVSTTQIKAQHSPTSVSPFYSIWCIVYWQNSERATCLPPPQPHLMPPDGSLNFGILQEMSTECCWNDCSAKWLWFVCVAC